MMTFQQIFHDQPQDLPIAFVNAWNAKDATTLASLFTDQAHFINVVGLWWKKREEIWKAHDYGFRVIFKNAKLSLRKTETTFLSEDICVVHARMKLEGQTSVDGIEKPLARFNVFTIVTKKYNLGWAIVAAHNTDQIPFKETNVIKEDGSMESVDYRQTKKSDE